MNQNSPNDNLKADSENYKQMMKLGNHLRVYQEKLLHITKRNRSLQLKKINSKHNFDLATLEQFKPGIIKKILAKTLENNGGIINILLDSVEGDEADAARGKLRKLLINLRNIEDETGQQTNFIGWPFIEGHATRDFFIRGPLVLFPISINRNRKTRGRGWEIVFSADKPILNGALIAAIKKKSEIEIPENIEEKFEEVMEDLAENNRIQTEVDFLYTLSQWFGEIIPIEPKLNNFTCKPINDLTVEGIKNIEMQKFHIINLIIMGSFPQANDEIFKDYAKLQQMSDGLDMGVVNDLLDIYNPDDAGTGSESEEINLDKTDAIELNTVLPSDSSQDSVILESKRSNLVVVRGPPGTGKSQVITNLICDALSNGKKILVVCQKRAALDVVYRRLAKIDLEKFAIILDKEHSDRTKMYEQLYGIMQNQREAIPEHEDVRTISGRIDKEIGFLSSLWDALHKPHPQNGITAQKLYTRLDGSYSPVLDIAAINPNLSHAEFEDYLDRFENIQKQYKKFENDSHAWFGRKSFAQYSFTKKTEIGKDIDALIPYLESSQIMPTHQTQNRLLEGLQVYEGMTGFLKKIKRRDAVKTIKEILKVSDVSEGFVHDILEKVRQGREFWERYDAFLTLFDEGAEKRLKGLASDVKRLGTALSGMCESLAEFEQMQEFDKKKNQYEQSMFEILSECSKNMPHDVNWTGNVRQEIMLFWLKEIERENEILLGNPFAEYDGHREALADLLEKKERLVIKKIQHDIVNAVTVPRGSRRSSDDKWYELKQELKKKRRVKPIRKLFESFGENLLTLSPCWLTSPEAVSKVFPLKRYLFDLVIVDEASQLAIERSLPFLYRAASVVIAGDENQLQPFDLFQIKDEETDDEDVSDEKSLFDVARVNHDPYQLEWHYRSKYQNLIDYSNHAFYHSRLQVAPNVRTDHSDNPPIRWIRCNGTWDKNQNHVEAEKTLQEVKRLWQTFSKDGKFPSIAVVTFNERQQELIDNEHEKLKDSDSEYFELFNTFEEQNRNERFAVKNIENIQGDERDIVIFSIGYAKDPKGNFGNRFGTLSQKGGKNRLNVAITRARESMVVICSISPSEIKETSTNDGPRILRWFLEYARAVDSSDIKAQKEILDKFENEQNAQDKPDEFDSDFEIQVHKRLEMQGYRVDTQIGQSGYRIDLAIRDPEDQSRYILAVECDGATYHSKQSAKERDVMRQKFLENKGWTIIRVWSSDWWRDPGGEIEKIVKKVTELQSKRL